MVKDRITPTQAVKLECRWCSGCKAIDCTSKVCKLKDESLSFLKRIKSHCLDCVGTKREVESCTGRLLFEDRLCHLHPYRTGANSKRKGIGNKKPTLRGLEFYRKQRTHGMFLPPKSDAELVGSGLGR